MRDVQDTETTTNSIADSLDSFDQDVRTYKIASYDALFQSGSIGFSANLDWYKKKPFLGYDFDFITGNGTVTSSGTAGTGIIDLHLSSYDISWIALQLSESGGIQPFSFPQGMQKRWYKISSALGDTDLNSYIAQYYNLTNLQNTQEEEVHLIKIVGRNSVPYDSLLVRNILGRKTLQWSGTTLDSLEKATLTFEKNGKEMEMVVSRK